MQQKAKSLFESQSSGRSQGDGSSDAYPGFPGTRDGEETWMFFSGGDHLVGTSGGRWLTRRRSSALLEKLTGGKVLPLSSTKLVNRACGKGYKPVESDNKQNIGTKNEGLPSKKAAVTVVSVCTQEEGPGGVY